MAAYTGEKSKPRIHTRPILSLLIGLAFITVILIVALYEAGKSGKTGGGRPAQTDTGKNTGGETVGIKPDISTIAVVLGIDKDNRTIRLYDIENKTEMVLNYTGGSRLDKYGQDISADRIETGIIADVSYHSKNSRIAELRFSNKAWEYIGVDDIIINPDDKIIRIAKTNYTYENPFVIDGDNFAALENLAAQDELTVRGIKETIWSITVTKGRGTVRLKDYDAFLGGNITIGYEAVAQITDDMVITVREGNYNLTVENGEYSGTKNITEPGTKKPWYPWEIWAGADKAWQTTFDIYPFGADLFIDNELTSYAGPVELLYGRHTIEVSLRICHLQR